MSVDYNKTLNLPKTDFPMRASLPEKEPVYLAEWEEKDLYNTLIKNNEGKPLWVLHDGPPYANGNIHIGTATNKIIKDFIVRYKNMAGFQSPFVPGWDMHGLPTERLALQKLGVEKDDLSRLEIRKVCRDYANEFVDIMTGQFKRLGSIGDWKHPYRTIAKSFEATQIKVFGEMAKKGYIYKGLKSVYWCPECVTALAEAEIEYSDDPVETIYVRFRAIRDNGLFEKLSIPLEHIYFIIWTTTTWTIPANVAIALGSDFDYDIVKVAGEYYVIAHDLMEDVAKTAKFENYEIVATESGMAFEGIWAKHPYLDRESMVVNGDFVTLETGTGAVHIAPGHGVEDFNLVTEHYPQLPVVVPVDDYGRMTAEVGSMFAGLTTAEMNIKLRDYLIENGSIVATREITHQYPHCWRCKQPVLFRATEQWFCSVEDFKDETVEAINRVKWTPSWGQERITNMVRDRSDWCISRQRSWGLPIPVFYCTECGGYLISDESIKAVSDMFLEEGSDSWYIKEPKDILPTGTKCPHCGNETFTKETDIMDVWFDSGSSHLSILEEHPELTWPYDLYLEGSDQYRGWFQSSLLTAVALKGRAPYKNVFSHGWVVDGEGKKMSKSLGNGVEPSEVVDAYGADILRLWAAASDYQADMRISPDILKQLSEAYRKIRNTARFILGNLGDFNPDSVESVEYEESDRWALFRLNQLLEVCREAYDRNEFHVVYHAIHNFCVVDMSNFYLDILKDRLYIERSGAATRRAAQETIYQILSALTLLVSPILAFTSEEIWKYLPRSRRFNYDSVIYNEIPKEVVVDFDEGLQMKWSEILALREDVKKALEIARNDKIIGASLEAKVTVFAGGDVALFYKKVAAILPQVFITSEVEIVDAGGDENISVEISRASGEKCERCWSFKESVGKNEAHPTLCARCAAIVS